jgi:hypothetical protein
MAMIDDKQLDQMLAAARPALPRRGEDLGAASLALMESIMREGTGERERGSANDESSQAASDPEIAEAPRARQRTQARRVYFGLAASILALLVISGIAIGIWPTAGNLAEARAMTPVLLKTTKIDGDSEEVLSELSEALPAQEPDDGFQEGAASTVQFQFWALEMSPDAPTTHMQPQRQTLETRSDGTVVLEQVAVGPVNAEGVPVEDPDAPQPGDVIWRQEFRAGEYMYLFKEPTDTADWGAYLREGEGLEPGASTSDYFQAVTDLLSERKLSFGKQSSLVLFLASLPNITVEGDTHDRLGREGVSFSTTEGDWKSVLVISPEFGVIAHERVYLGTDTTYVKAPAVMSYVSWY